jgi:hypothetical protein
MDFVMMPKRLALVALALVVNPPNHCGVQVCQLPHLLATVDKPLRCEESTQRKDTEL